MDDVVVVIDRSRPHGLKIAPLKPYGNVRIGTCWLAVTQGLLKRLGKGIGIVAVLAICLVKHISTKAVTSHYLIRTSDLTSHSKGDEWVKLLLFYLGAEQAIRYSDQ